MKKLSRKTVEEAAGVLGLKLVNNVIKLPNHDLIVDGMEFQPVLKLKHLGIQLNPELPEITQENLCKFYLLFKEWPEAKLITFDQSEIMADVIGIKQGEGFLSFHGIYDYCEITDPRWPCIEHERCELCEGVREIREKIKEIGG